MVDNRPRIGYTISCPVREGRYGGIAQLARALGSYPSCPRFKSRCRYHAAHAAPHGALVKRLRHRPFTAVTRVRFPYASPTSPIWRHSSAGRALASHARGHRFEFCCLHHEERHDLRRVFLFCSRRGVTPSPPPRRCPRPAPSGRRPLPPDTAGPGTHRPPAPVHTARRKWWWKTRTRTGPHSR